MIFNGTFMIMRVILFLHCSNLVLNYIYLACGLQYYPELVPIHLQQILDAALFYGHTDNLKIQIALLC